MSHLFEADTPDEVKNAKVRELGESVGVRGDPGLMMGM